jgi:nucleoside-diphosphate-sugar epimerase
VTRVAVTGATGLLGRYAVAALVGAGHEVTALSRGPRRRIGTVETVSTDYSLEDLRRLLEGQDSLIHLAAVRGGSGTLASFAVNVDLTEALLRACASRDVPRVVLASTISVYSGANPRPWSESSDPVPSNNYGLSKLAMEKVGARAAYLDGLAVTSLRFGHLYGALEDNDYLVNRFFRSALEGKDLRVTPPSQNRREMVFAQDAARACVAALGADVTGPVNVPGYERLTNFEIATAVSEGFGTGSRVVVDPSLVDDVNPTSLDATLSSEELGYAPRWPMLDACRVIRAEMEEASGT